MKAVNLYLLTRNQDPEAVSSLHQALTQSKNHKRISPHEAACLCMLTDLLAGCMRDSDCHSLEQKHLLPPASFHDWISYFDGFFFSYTIDHIGKEFDLLKFSSDGEYAINIELKSEDIGEERIKKQLEQNRYYLAHAVHELSSFTFVMSSGTIYSLNENNDLCSCQAAQLAGELCRPVFRNYLAEGIDRFFRSSDYLISPVAAPEKFLKGHYFLTNQQNSFRQSILDHIKKEASPVICVTGSAGTGKTLLLFDLALLLSKHGRVLLVHSGPLRQGHHIINENLADVDIVSVLSADDFTSLLSGYSFLLIDEADHLQRHALKSCLQQTKEQGIPVVLAYDTHELLREVFPQVQMSESLEYLKESGTLRLAFTGHIRINRPVYSFLRTLLHLSEHPGNPDYSCIDVLYAGTTQERDLLVQHYTGKGFLLIHTLSEDGREDTVIAQEYCKVIMVIDESFYYDESLHLCQREGDGTGIRLLYEGLSRTRENLCLIVSRNRKLYEQILAIRLNRIRERAVRTQNETNTDESRVFSEP